MSGPGADRITDFRPGDDKLDLSDLGTRYAALDIAASIAEVFGSARGGTRIDYGAGTIFLAGVAAHDLGADDFIF